MATVGLTPAAIQRDFSGGMFRGTREDLIPENGAYDIVNGLLEDDGAQYRRGGTTYKSSAPFGSWITFIWSGYLGTGGTLRRTVIGTTTDFGVLNDDGTVTSLAGAGLPNPRKATAFNGLLYLPGGVTYNGTTLITASKIAQFYAVAGNRLWAGSGDTIAFTDISAGGGATTTWNANDFHQVPEGVNVLGLAGLRNALVAFTTGGVWVYSNIGLDMVDATGNVQHRVDKYSSDLVLWGDAGIAAWEGGLIVPAMDAVWEMKVGVASEAPAPFNQISRNIQALYREYVNRGLQVGQACVYRGHYLLPILDGQTPVDLLVCRLDHPQRPWTRMDGFGAHLASIGYRVSPTAPFRPELLGGSAVSGRVLNLSYFDPGPQAPLDADGSSHEWSMQTRDMATGPLNKNTITTLRMAYELGDAGTPDPTISATFVSGSEVQGETEWGLFDWGQADWAAVADTAVLSGEAPVDPFGYETFSWRVGQRERFGRFRLRSNGPIEHLRLRSLEMYVRSQGRR
jgi:hypothetical protein